MGPVQVLLTMWLGTMFTYSASMKLVHYDLQASLLAPYRILPRSFAVAGGLALPWVELLAGVALLFGLFPPIGALLSAGLGASFACGTGWVLVRGAKVPCGCAGAGSGIVGRGTLVRALMIIAGSLLALALSPSGLPPPVAACACAIAGAPSTLVLRQRHRQDPMHRHHVRTHVDVAPDESARLRMLLASSMPIELSTQL